MEAGAMNPSGNGGLAWRVEQLEKEQEENERVGRLTDKHENELHGERGLIKELQAVRRGLFWVNTAMWALIIALVGAILGFALGGGPH